VKRTAVSLGSATTSSGKRRTVRRTDPGSTIKARCLSTRAPLFQEPGPSLPERESDRRHPQPSHFQHLCPRPWLAASRNKGFQQAIVPATPPSRSRDARADKPLRVPVRTTASSVSSETLTLRAVLILPSDRIRSPSKTSALPASASGSPAISDGSTSFALPCGPSFGHTYISHDATLARLQHTGPDVYLSTSAGSKSQRSSPKFPGSQMKSAPSPAVRVTDMQTNVPGPPSPARGRPVAETFVARHGKRADVHPARPPAGVGCSTLTIASSGSAASVQAAGPKGLAPGLIDIQCETDREQPNSLSPTSLSAART
jgi:hypothetical protein